MKCESCGKNEATLRYYENINGVKQELHLCSKCASKFGFSSFSDIFSPIFNVVPKMFIEETKEDKCDNCGYTFEKYLKNGYFGCPNCYVAFENNLDDLLLRLQGKKRHIEIEENKNGVKKNQLTKEEKIAIMKGELADLVKKEEYEKAAILRDKIKKMQEK